MNLIKRCLDGNQRACEELFHQYKNLVYKTAYMLLGASAEADDALQEIFLQVFRSLASFDAERSKFSTWLHRVTVNHCLNRRRARSVSAIPWHELPDSALVAEPLQLEQGLDQRAAIRQVLGQLSPKLQAVVLLRFYHDLSYQEIAQILELPLGTVKSRINLALVTLHRALLSREEDGAWERAW